ncbi:MULTISPECIES: hypothetical protein [unclassified Ruegeria]|uniref:hypothetical protein n=1 Tax=unclassified Ruegeria TaxID=2625375 RepID=UPI0014924FB2|nr:MULTISPECIES: hypothetical protein [unclassified Ruegeria]NOD35693.1 hypothetical protein [Ruegeria sp. HKCCD7296]NOE43060.1 hypothetical protein [Ruegeria sp. HKCCD7319]
MKDTIEFARRDKDQLVFLCEYCGQIHRHGGMDGHWISHCQARGDYNLYWQGADEEDHLTQMELETTNKVLGNARNRVRGVAELLTIIGLTDDADRLNKLVEVLNEYVDYGPIKRCRLEELTQ